MRRFLPIESLFAAVALSLTLLTGCGGCGSSMPSPSDAALDLAPDAPIDLGVDLDVDAGPRCVDVGEYRSCQCPGGAGPAITLACAAYPGDDTCHVYDTGCADDGFIACATSNFPPFPFLEARCRAFCASDGGVPDLAPCTGW